MASHEYALYALRDGGGLTFAEHFSVLSLFEAEAKAQALLHLDDVALVEVWEGPVCVLRIDKRLVPRQQPAPPV